MPDVAFLSASIPLLSPVLRNNWKVLEPACNCLGSLSNFRCAAATDPRKACYLLNFAKNSQFSGECPGETGSYLTAHTFVLTKYHRRPLKPVGRCVRPMTCMLVAESVCPTSRRTLRSCSERRSTMIVIGLEA